MPRLMHDSVTAADIPASATMVAGYVSGRYRWSDADWARFPNATKVRIATQANVNDGNVLDVEPGDASPAQAPGWVLMRRAARTDPTIYCGLAAWPYVRAAFATAGVPEPHYWIAHYDRDPTIPAGAVAKQFSDPATGAAGHYDLSSVAAYWPGIDPIPTPSDVFGPKTPNRTTEVSMERITITPPNAGQNSFRVFLSGTDSAAIVVRPRIDGAGNVVKPMWVGNIYAWGSDHQGVGGNPETNPAYDDRLSSHRRFALAGAVWADVNYSAAEPFDVDVVG